MNLNIEVFRSVKDSNDRLSPSEPLVEGVAYLELKLDVTKRLQTIRGFGGAFTEAGGWILSQLPTTTQDEILRAYFDPQLGHGYSLCRSHINSCDFSLGNYSCCNVEGDTALATFDISHEEKWLLPYILRALAVPGAGFDLLLTPWSPPAWMKTNGSMNGGGRLKPEYWDAWARLLAKFRTPDPSG